MGKKLVLDLAYLPMAHSSLFCILGRRLSEKVE